MSTCDAYRPYLERPYCGREATHQITYAGKTYFRCTEHYNELGKSWLDYIGAYYTAVN